MHIIDFDIEEVGSKRLTEELIRANASFDIKEVLSDRTSIFCSAVSILTQSQTVNVAFLGDQINSVYHISIADLLLSRIYPDYKHVDDIDGLCKEKNSIILFTSDYRLWAPNVTNDFIPTYNQFHDLRKLLENIRQSDYCTKNSKGKFEELLWGKTPYSIDQIDDLLNSLRKKIYDKRPVNQYKFNYDFSKCKTEEDFKKQAREYAQKHFESNNLLYGTSEATR